MNKILLLFFTSLLTCNIAFSQNKIVQFFDEPIYQRDQFYFFMNEKDSGSVVDLIDGIHQSKYFQDANEAAREYFTSSEFLNSCTEINVSRIVIFNKYFSYTNGKNDVPSFEITGMIYGKSDTIEFHASRITTEKYNYMGYAKWYFTLENGHWSFVEVNM